jgi:hypothetical protein
MKDSRIYPVLAMAGATPFVACALLPLFGVDVIDPLGPLDAVAASYGMAIVSFLTGIHWATRIYGQQQSGANLLIISNVVFVAVWLAYALGTTAAALLAQLVALLVVLAIDRSLLKAGVITGDYYRTRSMATVLAAASMAIILLVA